MSLFKRGDTWWLRFTAPNGKRIRRSAGTTDKQAAQEYHDYLKVEMWRVHRLGEKPRRTWQEATVPTGLELYLQYWFADAGGVQGFAASNGLRARTP